MGLKLRVTSKANVEKNNEEEGLEPVSPKSEVFFNHDERPICILVMFESEIPINVTALYAFLKDDVLPCSPRFSSIMIEDKKGKKMWKKVDVNIQDHVKIPTFPEGLSPESYNQHYYDDYLSKISKEQISKDKPLWECHLFKYPISHACHGVIILKFHHAMADGVSLMGSLFSSLRRADDPSLPLSLPSSRPKDQKKQNGDHGLSMKIFSMVPKFICSIFYFFYDFGQGVKKMFLEDDMTPIRSGNHPHSTRFSTATFSLDDVKKIKTRIGVTVNDVVLGAIFLGTHLYSQEINPEQKRARSTALIPANIRRAKGYAQAQKMHTDKTMVPWGNKFSIFQITIPNFEQDALANPLNFVTKPHRIFKRMRTSLGQHLVGWLVDVAMEYGGPKVAARIFNGAVNNSSLVISNMIGPIEQMSLANHPINGFYFMLVGMKMSLGVTVMSYMQNLRIGFGVEEGFIDQHRLIKCVENAFEMILQAAMTTTSECTSS